MNEYLPIQSRVRSTNNFGVVTRLITCRNKTMRFRYVPIRRCVHTLYGLFWDLFSYQTHVFHPTISPNVGSLHYLRHNLPQHKSPKSARLMNTTTLIAKLSKTW